MNQPTITGFTIFLILALIISGAIWFYSIYTSKTKPEPEKESEVIAYARGIFLIAVILLVINVFKLGILLILTLLTFGSLLVWLFYKFFMAKRFKQTKKKEPMLVDYARSLFPIFLIVLLIRSFIIQPFRVPTGSLEPTIMPGDFVAVSQFAYGLRLPVLHTKIVNIGEPKLGDIVVFRYPVNPKIDFIKRVIGVPGDHVVYKNKVLYINGKEMKQTLVKRGEDVEPGNNIPSKVMMENLNGVKHEILIHDRGGEMANFDFTVPKGYYFMMGDNRDNSADSRVWGLVPEKNIIGKAFIIWFSWNGGVNWSRIGNKL